MQEVRVLRLKLTSDIPGGEKQMGMKVAVFDIYVACRTSMVVWVEGSNHYYVPQKDPSDKRASRDKRFDIKDYNKNRWTGYSRNEPVDIIEAAGLRKRSKASVEPLMRDGGYNAYSLMECPRPANKAAYPHMSYMRDIRSSSAPYHVMHLVLQTPHIRPIRTGTQTQGERAQECEVRTDGF